MNAGFGETHLIVIFANSIKTSLSLPDFQKEPFFPSLPRVSACCDFTEASNGLQQFIYAGSLL